MNAGRLRRSLMEVPMHVLDEWQKPVPVGAIEPAVLQRYGRRIAVNRGSATPWAAGRKASNVVAVSAVL